MARVIPTPEVSLDEYSKNGNILHNFRSYIPFISLSAVELEAFQATDFKRSEFEKYVKRFTLMQSGGKGAVGINTSILKEMASQSPAQKAYDSAFASAMAYEGEDGPVFPTDVPKEIRLVEAEEFNKESAGRFDFYFGQLDIGTLTSFQNNTGYSFGTKLEFEIFEPYSIGGLIEALHAYAVAAGYSTWTECKWVLRIGFKGYRDDTITNDIKNAVQIEPATRYFPFQIGNIEVKSTSAEGTKYRITGFPLSDLAFAQPSVLPATITATGQTVKEMLKDFFVQLQKSMIEAAKKVTGIDKDYDEYEIRFPKKTSGENPSYDFREEVVNEIGESKLVENDEIEAVVQKTKKNPTQAAEESKKSIPSVSEKTLSKTGQVTRVGTPNNSKLSITFPANTTVLDAISAICRDSVYSKNIFVNWPIDEHDMVNYFVAGVRVSKRQSGGKYYSDVLKRPMYRYTFYVVPHKIHFSRVPGFQDFAAASVRKLRPLVRRQYDYLFTGNNKDILSFDLKYDALYFQSLSEINQNLKINPDAPYIPNARPVATLPTGDKAETVAGAIVPTNPSIQLGSTLAYRQSVGIETRPPSNDPYSQLVRALHQSLLNPIKSLRMSIEIVGDPFYLVQSGISNIITSSDDTNVGITMTGDADYETYPILVEVNMKNAKDYGKDGIMQFNEVATFSGVYQVLRVETRLAGDGTFKQKLDMIHVASNTEKNTDTKPAAVKVELRTQEQLDYTRSLGDFPG